MILGLAKLSKTLNLNFSTKQLLCFLCIVTTQYLEWIYIIVTVINNQYIYIVASLIYTGPDWEKFNLFFKHHYQLDFTVATMVLMPITFTFAYIWRIIYCLISCVRKVGTWKTLLFLKNNSSAFWISILTNLAIYDMHLNDEDEDDIEDPNDLGFEDEITQAISLKINLQTRRMSLEIKNAKPHIKIQKSQSLPILPLTSSNGSFRTKKLNSHNLIHCTSIVSLYTPDSPAQLNIKKSINLFSLWALPLAVIYIVSIALDSSRDDIFVRQILFRLMLLLINIFSFFYMIR